VSIDGGGGLWCPSCGAEYRPGFERCADCQVALVTASALPAPVVVDHDVVEYDLGDWDHDQRAALALLLGGRAISHGWRGPVLTVPKAREADTDELIDEIDEKAAGSLDIALPTEPAEDGEGPVIASAGRRLVGALCDGMILGFVTAPLQRGVFEGDLAMGRLTELFLTAVYVVIPTALWGRTAGKAIVGTSVVSADDLAIPSWRQATVRWMVPALSTLAVAVLPVPTVASVILLLAVEVVIYGGILRDARRRGLHDRAAGTLVLQ
jgi:uncharacterized RDD family membrane protein YckC